MKKYSWMLLLLCTYLLIGGSAMKHIYQYTGDHAIQMSVINQITKEAEMNWNTGNFKQHPPYEYAVIDNNGAILYQSADGIPLTVYDTVKSQGAVLDLTVDRQVRGKVLISTGYEDRLLNMKKQTMTDAVMLTVLLLIPACLYTFFLNQRIVKPFLEMKSFARHVAMGSLDFPLPMDKHHIFGAFTESFDIMREQLKEARQKEAAANQSKKELVASLSHDIRTPVSSIKLISELLLVTETNDRTLEKVNTIHKKSQQIDHLISNMLQASLEDLGELKVELQEVNSAVLEDIIRDADYYARTERFPIPGCILTLDPLRMEQIIGNIINNSYKYADTPITVVSQLTEDGLRMEFKDYGKGVPEEELPYLFQKFYRGSSHIKTVDGSGLGLYISRYLMEKMGGMIDCFNRDDGFSIVLFIPLVHSHTKTYSV